MSLTADFPGYSDFNFISLLSWNLHNSFSISRLYNNLVILFQDYVTNESSLTFLGHNELAQTTRELLIYSESSGFLPVLKLLPEHVAMPLAKLDEFRVEEDADNHDYIISLRNLAELAGSSQRHTRRLVKKFEVLHGESVSYQTIDCGDRKIHQTLFDIFLDREGAKDNDHTNELAALKRLLHYSADLPIHARGLFVDGELRAFILFELEDQKKGSVGHFWKADAKLSGIYYYLLHRVSVELSAAGFEFMNIEQDLGIPGLRQAKQLLRPVSYLKKFTLSRRLFSQTGIPETTDEPVGMRNLLAAHLSDLVPHAKGPEPADYSPHHR